MKYNNKKTHLKNNNKSNTVYCYFKSLHVIILHSFHYKFNTFKFCLNSLSKITNFTPY